MNMDIDEEVEDENTGFLNSSACSNRANGHSSHPFDTLKFPSPENQFKNPPNLPHLLRPLLSALIYPFRVSRTSLLYHGIGIVLYFNFLFVMSILLLISAIPWFFYLAYRFVNVSVEGGDVSIPCHDTAISSCILYINSENSLFWWLLHYALSVVTSLVQFLAVIYLQKQQLEYIYIINHVYDHNIQSKSILITSTCFTGILDLLPQVEDIRLYFSKYGSITDILYITDDGNLINLYKLQHRLVHTAETIERRNQLWRRLNGIAYFVLCKLCYNLTKSNGVRQLDRIYNKIKLIKNNIIFEKRRDKEGIGSVIISFESNDVILDIMSDNNLGHSFIDLSDSNHGYASNCWYKSVENVLYYNENHNFYVHVPPSPNDIIFENFKPENELPNQRINRKLYSVYVVVVFLLYSYMYISFNLLQSYYSVSAAELLGFPAAYLNIFVIIYATRIICYNTVQYYYSQAATYTILHYKRFQWCFLVNVVVVSPILVYLLHSYHHKQYHLPALLLVVLYYHLLPLIDYLLCFSQPESSERFDLGGRYTNHLVVLFIAYLTSCLYPPLLLAVAMMQLASFALQKAKIVRKLVKPKYDEVVAVNVIHWLPLLACLNIAVATLHFATYAPLQSMSRLYYVSLFLVGGVVVSFFLLVAARWVYLSDSKNRSFQKRTSNIDPSNIINIMKRDTGLASFSDENLSDESYSQALQKAKSEFFLLGV